MKFGVIYFAYEFTKELCTLSRSPTSVLYLKAIIWCAVGAWAAESAQGSHYEEVDALFGGAQKVIDKTPDEGEKIAYFWQLFLIFALSACSGVSKARKSYRYNKIIAAEKAKLNSEE